MANKEDVQLVIGQIGRSEQIAIKALEKANGDLARAIRYICNNPKDHSLLED